MDFDFKWHVLMRYQSFLIDGVLITVQMALLGMAIALTLGLIIALMAKSGIKILEILFRYLHPGFPSHSDFCVPNLVVLWCSDVNWDQRSGIRNGSNLLIFDTFRFYGGDLPSRY